MRYGYIGLGNLGEHLAVSLLRAGFRSRSTTATALPPSRCWRPAPTWARRRRRLAARCDAVFTCLPSPAVSEAVLTGPDGILAGLRTRRHLDRDEDARPRRDPAPRGDRRGARHRRRSNRPVTGGVHKAAAGEITVLAGGDQALFEQHRPALRGDGRQALPHGPARVGRGHQGHHQHAGLHPSRRRWRGADAGQARRARSGQACHAIRPARATASCTRPRAS